MSQAEMFSEFKSSEEKKAAKSRKRKEVMQDEEGQRQKERWYVGYPDRPRPVINHFGVSGGKDSCAAVLWGVHESGYEPATIRITACDTYNEHEHTYDTIRRLSEHVQKCGVQPIEILDSAAFMQAKGQPPIRGFYQLAKWKKRFPGAKSRFCTQFLKVFPTRYYIECLIALLGCRVVLHSGVRADESHERGKLVVREQVNADVEEFRPLLKWSIGEVWSIHQRYGFEPNPLYELGAKRVGCLPCIMSRKAEVANIASRWPARIRAIRLAENSNPSSVGFSSFFPRNSVPLRFRSKKIRTKDGSYVMVCTIDDVVEWATEPIYAEAQQFKFELDTSFEDRTACQSTWGACE